MGLKQTTTTETKYGITENEMLSVFLAMKKILIWAQSTVFLLETDHETLLGI